MFTIAQAPSKSGAASVGAEAMEGMGEDMEEELEDDGQSELARMQKANLGDTDLAEYAIKGGDKVRQAQRAHKSSHSCSSKTFAIDARVAALSCTPDIATALVRCELTLLLSKCSGLGRGTWRWSS